MNLNRSSSFVIPAEAGSQSDPETLYSKPSAYPFKEEGGYPDHVRTPVLGGLGAGADAPNCYTLWLYYCACVAACIGGS